MLTQFIIKIFFFQYNYIFVYIIKLSIINKISSIDFIHLKNKYKNFLSHKVIYKITHLSFCCMYNTKL